MFGFRSDIDYHPKKRAKTAKIDNFPSELRDAVAKKVFNKKTSKFTQWQYKNYASDVLEYMCEILQSKLTFVVQLSQLSIILFFVVLLASSHTAEIVSKQLIQSGH